MTNYLKDSITIMLEQVNQSLNKSVYNFSDIVSRPNMLEISKLSDLNPEAMVYIPLKNYQTRFQQSLDIDLMNSFDRETKNVFNHYLEQELNQNK